MSLPVYGTKKVIKNRLIAEYLKTIEEEDNNERSDEDETDEVEELARNELIAECRSKKLMIRGNKDALAKRLAEYQVVIIIIVLVTGTFIFRAIFGNNT